MKKIDTFSAYSLKVLEKNKNDFINKFIYNLSILKQEKNTDLGNKYHALICSYIRGFDISKMILELDRVKQENFKNFIKNHIQKKENFIKTEFPFLIKEEFDSRFYYLVGRFDAIYKENDNYIIYDWKTLNIPKNPKEDLQSVVYLYALNKIFNTEKITMRYMALEKDDFSDVVFDCEMTYKKRIDEIIKKYYN